MGLEQCLNPKNVESEDLYRQHSLTVHFNSFLPLLLFFCVGLTPAYSWKYCIILLQATLGPHQTLLQLTQLQATPGPSIPGLITKQHYLQHCTGLSRAGHATTLLREFGCYLHYVYSTSTIFDVAIPFGQRGLNIFNMFAYH